MLPIPDQDSVADLQHNLSLSEFLRKETASAHERVDAAFAAFALDEAAGYRAMLVAHAMALPGVERALADAGLLGRERASAIAADLADLGEAMPQAMTFAVDVGGAIGALYVSEGSRLGGGLVARSVPEGWPKRYLTDVHLPGEWRAIRGRIDAGGDREAALAGAQATFALYQRAAEALSANGPRSVR